MNVAGASVDRLLALGSGALATGRQTAHLEAALLLGGVLELSRAELYAHSERTPSQEQIEHYQALIERRVDGWPVAYLLGAREFWSLRFELNRHTLIPRPETELLVERALACLPAGPAWRIAELGTGCGAIAAALAVERPQARIQATEICPEALRVAQRNLRRLLPDGAVKLQAGDWLEPLQEERYDLIVSNPPYVRWGDPCLQRGDLRFEPPLALIGGTDGFAALQILLEQSLERLKTGGWLLLEHGHTQGQDLRKRLQRRGYRQVQTHRDLAGRERVTVARAPGT